MLESLTSSGFEILTMHHAEAILTHDMPQALQELEAVLSGLTVPVEELVRGGGGEGKLTQRLRNALADGHGWHKHVFEIRKTVDGREKESVSHEIDHVKHFTNGVFALEIEWNNKDPFFDRDLENFKRLHADGVISVGGIITRGASLHASLRQILTDFATQNRIESVDDLQRFGYSPTPRQRELIQAAAGREDSFAAAWARVFVADKFGEATTHWRKLKDRVHRGVGNPCPLLLIGLPAEIVSQPEDHR